MQQICSIYSLYRRYAKITGFIEAPDHIHICYFIKHRGNGSRRLPFYFAFVQKMEGMLSYRINEASGRLLLTAAMDAVMDTDHKYIVVVEFPELFS